MEETPKRTYTKKPNIEKVLEQILTELRRLNARQNVEDYLLDWINKKYTGRIISKLNTEWENLITSGADPGKSEYEHMRKRALEVHREEFKHEESTENPLGDSRRNTA